MGLFSEAFESALSFFMAPVNYVADSFSDAAQWCWEVIQGDFNEEQTTAQIVTGTVISMIPFVDQICDVRDIIANGKKINEDKSDTFAWIALVFTLIGLVPVLGSLVKGCLKVLFAPIRRLFLIVGKKMNPEMVSQVVNKGVKQLLDYLETPVVQKTIKALGIRQPLKMLANQLDNLRATISVKQLNDVFDTMLGVIKQLMDKITPWLPTSTAKKCRELWDNLLEIRRFSDKQLANALGPVHELMEKFANKLHHENGKLFRASHGDNFHKINRIKDTEIIEQGLSVPRFYSNSGKINRRLESLSQDELDLIKLGFPNSIKTEFSTFSTLNAVNLEPGTKLVRVVDPKSSDNSFCWMRLEEFEKLKSRDQWRDVFAVKTEWNSNGEYVMYTVPENGVMKVWEGKAATQDIDKTDYFLRGGGIQIVVDPKDLDPLYLSGRKLTNWGYGEVNHLADDGIIYLGVPDLTQNVNNWYQKGN